MNIIDVVKNSGYEYNEHYLNRYLKFITSYKLTCKQKYHSELHHILPKSLFPQYSNLKNNSFNACHLPTRAHFVAHGILCKVFYKENSVWFAYTAMGQQKNEYQLERTQKSVFYQKAKNIAYKRISENKKGTKMKSDTRGKLKEIRNTYKYRSYNIWNQIKDKQNFESYDELRNCILDISENFWNIPSQISKHIKISEKPIRSIMILENIPVVKNQKISKVYGKYNKLFKSYEDYTKSIVELHNEGYSIYVIAEKLNINVAGVQSLLKQLNIDANLQKRKTGPNAKTNKENLGMTKNTHIWITDGIKEMRISKESSIPRGFHKGRVKKSFSSFDQPTI